MPGLTVEGRRQEIPEECNMSNYKLGYARVSTLEQDEALQLDALHQAGCDRIEPPDSGGGIEPTRRWRRASTEEVPERAA